MIAIRISIARLGRVKRVLAMAQRGATRKREREREGGVDPRKGDDYEILTLNTPATRMQIKMHKHARNEIRYRRRTDGASEISRQY